MLLFTGLAHYVKWKSQQLRDETMAHQTMDAHPNMMRRENAAMEAQLDRAAAGLQAGSRTKAQTLQARILELENVNNRLRGLIGEVNGNQVEGVDPPTDKAHLMSLSEILNDGPAMLDHFTNQIHDSIAELRSLII